MSLLSDLSMEASVDPVVLTASSASLTSHNNVSFLTDVFSFSLNYQVYTFTGEPVLLAIPSHDTFHTIAFKEVSHTF